VASVHLFPHPSDVKLGLGSSGEQGMKASEDLERRIDALREIIQQQWQDIARLELSEPERLSIRERIRWCAVELWQLDKRLDEPTKATSGAAPS